MNVLGIDLSSLGLFPAKRPEREGMPSLPDDPTSINDEEVMNLFFELTEWGCYARSEAVAAAVAERWAERELALKTAEAVKDAPGKTLADRRSAASLTTDVLDAEVSYIDAWARRKALDEAAESAERRAAALSRELSRRGAKTPRSSRWGT